MYILAGMQSIAPYIHSSRLLKRECTYHTQPISNLRKRLLRTITTIIAAGVTLLGCRGGDTASAPHLTATLIADQDSISPGSTFTLGVQFTLEPGWHIYWKNPGDSGLPPRFNWTSSADISVSPPLWPYPTKLSTGPLVNYGYGDVVIPFQAQLSSSAPVGKASISANLEWLVCKDECLPGQGTLNLELPIRSDAALPSRHAKSFDDAFKNVPTPLERVSIAIEEQADQVILALIPIGDRFLPPTALFFPDDRRIISNSSEQIVSRDGDVLRIALKRDPNNQSPLSRLRGVLWSEYGWSTSGTPRAVAIDTNPDTAEPDTVTQQSAASPQDQGRTQPAIGFLAALISALVGGLLLNIMPCVFPVLSIKILGFVEHSRHDLRTARLHGFSFAGGVIVSFWAVAATLYVLRAGGEQLGWGFQLQSPIFVVAMMITFLIISLMFLGEVTLGQQLQNIAGRARIPTSLLGSFLNGALATLVATPCTAPYMGTALAATLALPPYLSVLIFTALGVGMSAPYILLAWNPSLLRYLPKPGAWMEIFKQLMAFPLLASVVWLTRVFMRQMGLQPPALSVVSNALWGLLGLAFAFWIYARTSRAHSSRTRMGGALVASIIAISCIMRALPSQQEVDEVRSQACSTSDTAAPFTDSHGLLWEPFSEERLSKVLAQGRPVLLDFTAEWCITCQVNEQLVFSSTSVRELLALKNVTLFRGDWTSKDPAITRALNRFGRNGVPLNVIIASPSEQPLILPNILTPAIVEDALRKLP